MVTPTYTINTPLINYFIYKDGPQIGTPLVNGTIEFFTEADHTVHADTYSDISDPNNPVVNTNPIVLDAVGSCPVIYLQNIYYFIIIKSQEGETIQTYTFYRGAAFNGSNTPISTDPSLNLLANGQFNYPVVFYKNNSTPGKITKNITNVAFAWNFLQNDTSTENFVFFDNIANEILEGRPLNQLRVTSGISTTQTEKALQGQYGHVSIFEGIPLTFSCQLINLNIGDIPVIISIEKNYGALGSPSTITPIATFTVNQIRTKFFVNFISPSVEGLIIGDGNYEAIRIEYPLNQPISIGITNCFLQTGTILEPEFLNQDLSSEKSQILGNATYLEPAGLDQNYNFMRYIDGNYYPVQETGIITFSASIASFPDKLKILTPGQTLKTSDYNEKDIPYKRLYDVIGTTYGGTGELIVTSNLNVVTASSSQGAIERSTWTTGTVGSAFTIVNTVPGLRFGIDTILFPGGTTREVEIRWQENFIINQSSWPGFPVKLYPDAIVGNGYSISDPGALPPPTHAITSINIAPGSPTTEPVAKITFASDTLNDYRTYNRSFTIAAGPLVLTRTVTFNYLEFGLNSLSNIRGKYLYDSFNNGGIFPQTNASVIMRFQVDGQFGPLPVFNPQGLIHTIDFNLISSQSITQNVSRFIQYISNPFTWTITINSPPAPGQYFLYSAGPKTTGTEFYGWYTVNGAGVDPAVGGRTGVQIDILSIDTLEQIARKTADKMNSLEFNLPTPGTHLPALPSPLTSYFINL